LFVQLPTGEIGFVCTASPGATGRNWVCLYNRPTLLVPRSPAHVASARIGFVSHDRTLPGAPFPRSPILPRFGFVCSQGHLSSRLNTPDWVCLYNRRPAKFGLLPERHRATRRCRTIGSSDGPACLSGGGKLGLFVRRAPARPGGIGFVCTTGPRRPQAAGRSGRPAKLGLFRTNSHHADSARPSAATNTHSLAKARSTQRGPKREPGQTLAILASLRET
jgi:hypothetical protein